jgi:ABC-2 type transport system ATP-binding protein
MLQQPPTATQEATPGRQSTPPETARPVDSPPKATADAAATLDHVSRRFDDVVAVRDLSLTVPAGTILGLIGPSGSGKTSTIRMLTGALRPTKGRVLVLGEDPTRFRRATRARIGYLPQLSVLYPELTAWENVDFVASLYGMLLPRRVFRVRNVLRVVGLAGAYDRLVAHLSGGMRRRVSLACALVADPEFLFLDEPTTGIDPIVRQSIWAELARLRDLGRTILVTTQYVSEADQCDLVALVAEGRLVAFGPPGELRERAGHGRPVADSGPRPFDDVFVDLVRQAADVR